MDQARRLRRRGVCLSRSFAHLSAGLEPLAARGLTAVLARSSPADAGDALTSRRPSPNMPVGRGRRGCFVVLACSQTIGKRVVRVPESHWAAFPVG